MDRAAEGRRPFVGASVLYVLSTEDAARCAMAAGQAERRAEAQMHAGQKLPAIVTRIFEGVPGTIPNVNLQVFPDGPGSMFFVLAIPYNSRGMVTGSWSWPDDQVLP